MSTAQSVDPRGPSLRERKKQHTRDALVEAAFELFGRQGFEATTVDEIAEAVPVSARTFFRYFASKDDVVIQFVIDQYTAVFAAFDERPADEPVLTALRHATVGVLAGREAGQGETVESARFACMTGLFQASPALAARSMEQCASRIGELAEKIAGRMGVAAADPRPLLVASVMMSAIQTAAGAWRAVEPEVPLSVLVDRAFRLLEEGINYPAAVAQ
jgi:AcrR family transcriptional regulator